MKKATGQTTNITPTWTGLLPMFLALCEGGTGPGRATAEQELLRMARVADWASTQDMQLATKASNLREQFGHWTEHPDHSHEQWRLAVETEETLLGYWEWIVEGGEDE